MNAKVHCAVPSALSPPVGSGLLQRQCGCGQHTIAGNECEGCRGEREKGVPDVAYDVLNAPGEPLDEESRSEFERSFARDGFSHVPARAAASSSELTMGAANDPLEREADYLAARATGGRRTTDPGEAVDLGHVRIHRGTRAEQAARAVHARAFTVGSHIVFGAGAYDPRSADGHRLLAHELAHVLQQTGWPSRTVMRKVAPGKPTRPEDERANSQPADSPIREEVPPQDDKAREDKEDRESVKEASAKPGDTSPAAAQANKAANPDPKQSEQKGDAESPKNIAEQSTGELAATDALIDTELAEHERWGAARAIAGAAGTGQRAEFIATAAGAGTEKGLVEGVKGGATSGAAIKVIEKVVEKGATVFATKIAAKLGTQVAKFTPLAGVGAVIGGVMSAFELAARDWKATGATLGRVGQGSSDYEKLANTIEGISTILEIATQVINVVAGVIGLISVIIWAVSVATLGVTSPLALTLSTIAGLIGLGTMALDGINALVLKRMIALFRTLHAFTSDADPSDVVKQGNAIAAAAGATGGFIGGVGAGLGAGAAIEGGIHLASSRPNKPVANHPNPPAGTGEGAKVTATPPETKPASTQAPDAATPAAPDANATVPKAVADPVAVAPEVKAPEVKFPEAVTLPEATPVEGKATPPLEAVPDASGGSGGPKKPGKSAGGGRKRPPKDPALEAEIKKLADHLDGKVKPKKVRQSVKELGMSADEVRALREQLEVAEQLPGTEFDPEFQKIPKAPSRLTAKEASRVKELTGEQRSYDEGGKTRRSTKMSKPVERSVRATSRKRTNQKWNEASADMGEQTSRTQESRENIEEHGLEHLDVSQGAEPTPYENTRGFDFVEDTKPGKPPPGFEEAHLVPVKQEPAFAHQGEQASRYKEKGAHYEEDHAANYSAELELLRPRGEKSPGFQEGLSPQSGAIVENRRILASLEKKAEVARSAAIAADAKAASASKRGNTKQAAVAQKEAAEFRESARNSDIQAQKMREALPKLDKIVGDASTVERRDLGRPAKAATTPAQAVASPPATSTGQAAPAAGASKTTAPADPAAPQAAALSTEPGPKSEPGPKVEPGPKLEPVATVEPGPPHEPGAPAQTAAQAAPAPGPAKARPDVAKEKPPGPASPKPEPAKAPEPGVAAKHPTDTKIPTLPYLPPQIPGSGSPPLGQGKKDVEKKEEGFFDTGFFHNVGKTYSNVKDAYKIDPKTMSTADSAIAIAGGPIAGALAMKAKREFAEGNEEASREPVVEHVNPHYAPPPCSPQDIVDVQNEILATLIARAKAEAAAREMQKQKKHHEDNQKPLDQMKTGTAGAISATEAHEQAIARRTEANSRSLTNEGEVKGAVEDYTNRAARLATLTGPMRAVRSFSSLAYSLPDSPDVLVGFKRHFIKLNKDCSNFLNQLDKMDTAIEEQRSAQGARGEKLKTDSTTIKETNTKAADSQKQLDDAKKATADFDAQNTAKGDDAQKLKTQATQTVSACDQQEQKKKAQAEGLARDLQAWAQGHKQARANALRETKVKYEKQGFSNVEIKDI